MLTARNQSYCEKYSEFFLILFYGTFAIRTMKDRLKRYFCGRRNIHLILACTLLAFLCLVLIIFFTAHGNNLTENEVGQKEPRIGISFIDKNADHYYVAAVIDYEVLCLPDMLFALSMNLKYITEAIAKCGRFNVDIAVFSEDSLIACPLPIPRTVALIVSTYVPSANDYIVPCDHQEYQQSFLKEISCAAKENRIYVAVNVKEKVRSPTSLYWDGRLSFYNTEVVFDRNGMVIARYRKYNLYTERWTHHIRTTDEPEYVTFDTDFGVKFGIFVCFDIFFTEPAVELVRKHNISHFIISSAMISRLPFLPASTVISGWSYALDVVVLSSSAALYPKYTLGTNINFGRRLGTRTYVLTMGSSNIIISPVPKSRHLITPEYPELYNTLGTYSPGTNRQTSFLVEHVLDRMTTKPLTSVTSDQSVATFSYKSRTFECNVSASWELSRFVPSEYRFVAYSGLNNFSVAHINYYAEVCGIILCSRYSLSSCQQPPIYEDACKSIFTSVNISTRSTSLDEVRIPAAFDSNLVALDAAHFDFKSRKVSYLGRTMNSVQMILKHKRGNLVTFAVYKFNTKAEPIINYSVFDHTMNLDHIL